MQSLETVLECLSNKALIIDEQANALLTTNVSIQELYSKQFKNMDVDGMFKYSPELKSFAHTLHFYSTRAYDYARNVLNLNLPHPDTVYNWYKSVNGTPGFTTEVLEALKVKANLKKCPLYCCLMINAMDITKTNELHENEIYGYEDFGSGLDTDMIPEAREALVFLVTGINAHWKVPVGYFLLGNSTSQQQADLVLQCLRHLNDSNITIVTIAGSLSYTAMANILGCKLEPNKMKTTFEHPVTKEPIAVLSDAHYMIKLVRNCLRTYNTIVNGNGKLITWNYFECLNRGQAMKNAEKIMTLDGTDLLATAEFIHIFNELFDILNSRNLNKIGYKEPLNSNIKSKIKRFLQNSENFIKGLRTTDGVLLTKSLNRTGIIGILVCIKSTKALFQHLIEENRIKSVSMYSFSQDNFNLFLSKIRDHCKSTRDPTSRQFQTAYKKMLNDIKIKKCNAGNYVALEKYSMLYCSSPIQIINATATHSPLTVDEVDCMELDVKSIYNFDEFCYTLPQLTQFNGQIITYMAGFVVRALQNMIKCDECNSVYCKKYTRH